MWDRRAEADRWLKQAENDATPMASPAALPSWPSAKNRRRTRSLPPSAFFVSQANASTQPAAESLGRSGYPRPAAPRPTVTAAGSLTMKTRKPCSIRPAMSSTPAVIPHGTPWRWHAASTCWMAASTASMSPW